MSVGKYQVIFLLISICIILIFLTFPYILPGTINPIDKSCTTDYDCVLKDTDCDRCDCGPGEAVNKNWNKFCPLGEIGPICACTPIPGYLDYKAICDKGICKRIKVPNCLGICGAPESYLKRMKWKEIFNKSLEEILKECNCSMPTKEESR